MKMDPEESTINEVLSSVESFDDRVIAIAALGDTLRRGIYRYVVRQGAPVSRLEAASHMDIAHHVAKFHLDRLVQDGLLEVVYARPKGRGGPGAGRPTKYYQRSTHEISVSLPDRRYDLVGHIFARAITGMISDGGTEIKDALRISAISLGHAMGLEIGRADQSNQCDTSSIDPIISVLSKWGFEPRQGADAVVLTNCPFCALASAYPEIICEMNLDLIKGFVSSLGKALWIPILSPSENQCCVVLSRSSEFTLDQISS